VETLRETVGAVVWEGPGALWRDTGWAVPVRKRLSRAGWSVTVVPWGDPGLAYRGLAGLHVFSGGEEPVSSGSPEMLDRSRAVEAAVVAAGSGTASVLGICLGAQMIASVVSGLAPRPVRTGGEHGAAAVRSAGGGAPDLVVGTAHVEEIPAEFLDADGVTHLWANTVTHVQGFRLGDRVVGVQFHPELSGRQAERASRRFRRRLGGLPGDGWLGSVDPGAGMAAVLDLAGASALRGDLLDDLHEGSHRGTRAALRRVPVRLALVEGGAGDVEVGPGHAVGDELLEEQAGGEHPALAGAGVGEVGDLGVDALAQLGGQGHRPHRLPGALSCRHDPVAQGVVAHHSGGPGAEGDELRTGQGRGVEEVVG
jgi:GMP synthase-like glutamine amidotransferase